MYSEAQAQQLLAKVKSLGGATPNPRVRHAVDRLLDVLFPLVLDLRLTEAEWADLLAHLDRTGAEGQFGVTAWLLGLSQLVQDMNSPLGEAATEQTILGPFYKPEAPARDGGTPFYDRLLDEDEFLLMSGRVSDETGAALPGVEIDAWGADARGRYSGWDEDQPAFNLRGRVRSDADGRYLIRTVLPRPYAIPPFLAPGAMLAALGRQAWRPPHLHFILRAAGCEPLVTQVYLAEQPYLDIDSAVAVKDSLVAPAVRREAGATGDRAVVEVTFDFCLQRQPGGAS